MRIFIVLIIASLLLGASSFRAQTGNSIPTQVQEPPMGWYRQVIDLPNLGLGKVFFLNKDTGWFGSAKLFGTTNGGSTWNLLDTSFTYETRFVDANNGWAIRSRKKVGRTTDGGKTWMDQAILSDGEGGLSDLQIFGLDTIYAFDSGIGRLTRSTNGGVTWQKSDVSGNGEWMSFTNSHYGFTVGYQYVWLGNPPPQKGTTGAGFAYTSDGGVTWHPRYCNDKQNLTAIFAIDSLHIYVSGDYGISYTENAGLLGSWKRVFEGGGWYGFFFFNAKTGYAVEDGGRIIFTNDTGKTWVDQKSGVTSILSSIYFVDSLTGWASGDSGIILHTIDGGKAWVREYLPMDSLKIQTYPEPFASSVHARYHLPTTVHVSVSIYDVTGNVVKHILTNELQFPGEHILEIEASNLSQGTYYLRIDTGNAVGLIKMTRIVF